MYRPVGPEELCLIAESGWSAFPPRRPQQPFFYPILQEEYAIKIASTWNVESSACGFVTRFEVDAAYLAKQQKRDAGGRSHQEYWIPASELTLFNERIVGKISLYREYFDDRWSWHYRLSEDRDKIDRVQRMTLSTPNQGLVADVALFGSDAWWSAILSGNIERNFVFGVLDEVLLTGHGDWPEIRVREWRGGVTRWNNIGGFDVSNVGSRVFIEYVEQRLRVTIPNRPTLSKVVLRAALLLGDG